MNFHKEEGKKNNVECGLVLCFAFNSINCAPRYFRRPANNNLFCTHKINREKPSTTFIEFNIMDETTEYKIYILINKIEKTCA